ncbi:hypothetical protein KCU68_g9862, partial [Aureobasidium melanogenum]
MSAQNSPLPSPGPATRINRPAPPRNAVMHRDHPPLYAGDFNNNLSKDMYWWEKLDVNDPEEKRVLLAMYYGEERRPRCSVCEKQNRACMWFLGEEEQTHKSCVKCRRVHATCKPSRNTNMETDVDDSRPSIEVRPESNQQQRTSLRKRKASEITDDQTEVIFVRSQDKPYAGKLESTFKNRFETPLRSGPSWMDSRPTLDDETQFDTLADRSTTAAEHRDGRLSSITLGADVRNPQEMHGQESHVREPRHYSQGNEMIGLSQIAKGMNAVINARYNAEFENLRTLIKKQAADHQAQMMALRADCTKKGQDGEAVDESQIEKLETQIETERSNRRWLEDEITRLKARRTSSATDTIKEPSQTQDGEDGDSSRHQAPVIHHRSLTTYSRNGAAIEQLDDPPPAKRHKISSSKSRFIVQEDSDDEIPIKTFLDRRRADARHDKITTKPISGGSRPTVEVAGPPSKKRRRTVIEIPDSTPPSSPLFCPTSEPSELNLARSVGVEVQLDDFFTVTGAANYTQIQERLRVLETESQSEKRQNRERVRKLEEQISTLREQQDHKLNEKIRELRKNMNYGFNQLMMQQPKEKKKS